MNVVHRDAVAWLHLDWGKANAISGEFLDALGACLDEIDASQARALVLAGNGRIFSAGLDLPTLHDLDRVDVRAFLGRFTDVLLRLFTHPRPVVACLNGHAVAGGLVLALQADHRLARRDKTKLGLNEIALGVGLPLVVLETLGHQLGAAQVRQIVFGGELVDASEALARGLVDAVHDDVEAAAQKAAEQLASRPPRAYRQIKLAMRNPVAERIRVREQQEGERWLDTWFSDEGRALIDEAVQRLRN